MYVMSCLLRKDRFTLVFDILVVSRLRGVCSRFLLQLQWWPELMAEANRNQTARSSL